MHRIESRTVKKGQARRCKQRNQVFVTNSTFLISLSISTQCCRPLIVKIQGLDNLSFWLKLSPFKIVHKVFLFKLHTHLCPFSKSKFNLFEAYRRTVSTLLHRLFLSIKPGTVQSRTGKVDPARKFNCTTAAVYREVKGS